MFKFIKFCLGQVSEQSGQQISAVEEQKSSSENNLTGIQITNKDLIKKNCWQQIQESYDLDFQSIGDGAYSNVIVGTHKKQAKKRAVKIIPKKPLTPEEHELMQNELEILKKLDHPNIVKIYEFYEDSNNIYIIEELCRGGELFEYIIQNKCITEKLAAHIFQQILYAVNYCHKNNIVHRDIKPENILLQDKGSLFIKICDFGSSVYIDNNKKSLLTGKFGTTYYLAPEIALEKQYNEKCDIWSCGVILYTMLSGNPPFNGKDSKEVLEKVKIGTYNFQEEEWQMVSQQAKVYISKLLELNPAKRYDSEQALNDPWLKKFADPNYVSEPQLLKCLNNLVGFKNKLELQDILWTFFVFNFISSKEKKHLQEVFNKLDENKDGKLSKQELLEGIKKFNFNEESQQIVQNIMKYVDKNHNNYIDFSEWLVATTNKSSILKEETLQQAFSMIDHNGNGFIEVNELEKCFQYEESPNESIWQQLIKEADTDGNGLIDYQEFKQVMNQLIKDEADIQSSRMQQSQQFYSDLKSFFE